MRIAIASEGKDLNSEISTAAARAPYFLIYEDKKLVESMKNPFAIGGGGAGWSVAHIMAQKEVELFIAGKLGENLETALNGKNIKFREDSGKKVSDILDEL
ncbi:NifB/NifX family molybdenum-iron cluster-binding protein [Methanococcus maripaludis]|uniref:Dinitrogenase iron-molybdenum cofactor biosynthesis domain-containing protein n=2 Tax=Methanococcus maripaludis TaxID=39152 RepID=A6VK46_METM7|nr:NifB/NifX family molybdenum-iron cluster-binding protein [Methanococcus maripaludis]MBA2862986.1 putative Fe-Mo cluster-binding NifX family protein [Methanococcus maripaludis]